MPTLSRTAMVGQVNQRLKGWEAVRWVDGAPQITDVLRAEVDRFGGIGALYGVLRADPWSAVRWGSGIPPERSAEAYAAVQEHVMRYGEGVPVLFVEEAPHGLMALGGTTLPVNLALGAGLDAELTRELGAAVAAEARERGTHLLLVSGLDVLRDPRWGRSEECFSEDPAIAAMLVEATVQGMQGAGPRKRIDAEHVAVVAKHLAGQGAGIGGRNGSGAPIGPRELGEIHLRPAFAAARAGVAGFMSAYNDIDGVPCTGSRDLLTGTLREAWGWDGIVMSDGGAIDRLTGAVGGRLAEAAALALTAGVDLSLWDRSFTVLEAAIDDGLVDQAALERAASRVLALKQRIGLLDGGSAQEDAARVDASRVDAAGADPTQVDPASEDRSESSPAWPSARARTTIALAERAARQAVIVLTGQEHLPLRAARVAAVGPNADDLDALLGDYTPPRPPEEPGALTVRAALAERLGAQAVPSARGSDLRGARDSEALEEVAVASRDAEATVVVLGGTSRRSYEDEFAENGAADGPAADTTTGEGVDLACLPLPQAQLDVVRVARAAGRPVIAVVIEGRPRALTELVELADAVLVVPFPGPSGGRAIVEALYGEGDRGVLPATLPVADGVLPVSHDQRLETARGYVDQRVVRGPLLGAGLSDGVHPRVTSGGAEVRAGALEAGTTVPVTVRLENPLDRTLSVPVLLHGRRHEPGILPRTRTVLAACRAEVPPGGLDLELTLGLDALGSWASGAPVAVPARVQVWAQQQLEPPTGTAGVRILG